MNNTALTVILIILIGIIAYILPQSLQDSYSNNDMIINEHKLILKYGIGE